MGASQKRARSAAPLTHGMSSASRKDTIGMSGSASAARELAQRSLLVAAALTLGAWSVALGQRAPVAQPLNIHVVAPTRAGVVESLRRMPNGTALAAQVTGTSTGTSPESTGNATGVALDFTRGVFAGANGALQVASSLSGAHLDTQLDPSGNGVQTYVDLSGIGPTESVVIRVRLVAPSKPTGWIIVSVQVGTSATTTVTLTPVLNAVPSNQVSPMVCGPAVLQNTADGHGLSTCVIPVPASSATPPNVVISVTGPGIVRVVSVSATPM